MVSRSQVLQIAKMWGAGLIVLAAAGLLLAWSGLYNVAASRGHWAVVKWLLDFGMRQSVETHSIGIKAPPLEDPSLVRLGAGHFHAGCSFCHRGPGMPIRPVTEQMLPTPPELSKAAKDWTPEELFWIVKHGLKYTGMPSWPALERDDEVWAVVAFLERLPDLDVTAYRELALGPVQIPEPSGRDIATAQSAYGTVAACVRCHGADGRTPGSSLVPVLHGQPVEFLARALRSYAAGERKSGIMQPVAAELDAEEIPKVAAYYAALPQPILVQAASANPANVQAGQALATRGAPERGVPPCLACHGEQALPTYPRLAGQHADYMVGQLQLWRRGLNATTDHGGIMAPIAQRLTEQQIEDVTGYFASLDPASRAGTQ